MALKSLIFSAVACRGRFCEHRRKLTRDHPATIKTRSTCVSPLAHGWYIREEEVGKRLGVIIYAVGDTPGLLNEDCHAAGQTNHAESVSHVKRACPWLDTTAEIERLRRGRLMNKSLLAVGLALGAVVSAGVGLQLGEGRLNLSVLQAALLLFGGTWLLIAYLFRRARRHQIEAA